MNYVSRAVLLTMTLACSLPAVPVTWHLRGVTFFDKGLALGSFTYDADTNTYSNVRIFTTPGSDVRSASNDPNVVRAGKDFTAVTQTFNPATKNQLEVQQAGPVIKIATAVLDLKWAAALTNAGGTVTIDTSESGEYLYTDNGTNIAGPSRRITAGTVVAANGSGPQTWFLSGVTMDDGSLAIGSFVYDASSNRYSQIQVQTTKGGTFAAGASYNSVFVPPSFNTPVATASNFAALTAPNQAAGSRVLNLVLSSPLTNAPATVPISLVTGTAEGTCSSASCSSNGSVTFGSVVRNFVSGSVTTTAPVGYSKAIPHFADGGSGGPFQSVMVFSNLSDAPTAFTARFFADDGSPLNAPGIGSVVTGLVPARGVVFLRSTGTATTLSQGWTRVDNAQNLSVSNQILWKGANSAGDQQGAMYGDPLGSNVVTVAYDNTNDTVNGFAVVNTDPLHQVTLLAIGYDVNGNIVGTDSSITLPPLGHKAFVFTAAEYAAFSTGQGNLRLFAVPDPTATGALSGINCLLLKSKQPNNAFANIAVTNQ